MFSSTKTAKANGAASAAGSPPYVPSLEQALPDLAKARTALELATERVGQLRAELNLLHRAYDALGPIPAPFNLDGSGQVVYDTSPEVAAAWRAKVSEVRAKIEQRRADLDQAKIDWQYCHEGEQRLLEEARQAVADQLRPYWQAVTRDFALAALARQADELIAIERARQLRSEMTAQGVEVRVSPYGEHRVSEIALGPWPFGPSSAAFSRAELLHNGVLELIEAGVLTAADVSAELARLWNL
jgi:hypothetical protein